MVADGLAKMGPPLLLAALFGTLFGALGGCASAVGGPESAKAAAQAAPAASTAEPAAPAYPLAKPLTVAPAPQIEYRKLAITRSSRADTPSTVTVEADEIPAQPTQILDPAMAERLFGNTGITVQWIGWEERGRTWVAVDEDGYWLLMGGQEGAPGERMEIEGFITEIGPDYFIYDGTIKILGAPNADRLCNVSKRGWRFGITQNRKYWRLREFEWCDSLTDYIDIYF